MRSYCEKHGHYWMSELLQKQIFNEDCISGMKKLQSNKMDLIITDPPFANKFNGKQSNYNRDSSLVLDGYVEIPQEEYGKFSQDWINQCYRILKDDGSIYICSGWNHLEDILRAVRLAGFTVLNHIIWKYSFGVVTKKKFVNSHYTIIYAVKNPKTYRFYRNCRFEDSDKIQTGGSARYRDMESVWIINRKYEPQKEKTPTKLPAELIEKMLGYSSIEDDLVFDPFLGSGQVAVVSKNNNRNYMGFEISKNYFNFICKRLEMFN